MKNKLFSVFLLLFTFFIYAQKSISLSKFPEGKVMVIAHRGDWRNAPENSVQAVKNAIVMGVNMAEIDLALTKDSVLVLMHDKTIDRTTTGTGKVGDYTLQEINMLYLRDGLGVKTGMKVPTLEKILDVSKGKIFLNLDKGFDYITLVFPMLEKRKMLDEVLFKGSQSYKDFDRKYSSIKNKIHYMPIIRLEHSEGLGKIMEYEESYISYGYEFTVGDDESKLIDFNPLLNKGRRIWVNSLWPEHNAGNNDDLYFTNPEVYSWYIDHHVNSIQTDRPLNLINYLKKRNLYQPN